MRWMDIPPRWRHRCAPSPEARERLLAYCERLMAKAQKSETQQNRRAPQWREA